VARADGRQFDGYWDRCFVFWPSFDRVSRLCRCRLRTVLTDCAGHQPRTSLSSWIPAQPICAFVPASSQMIADLPQLGHRIGMYFLSLQGHNFLRNRKVVYILYLRTAIHYHLWIRLGARFPCRRHCHHGRIHRYWSDFWYV